MRRRRRCRQSALASRQLNEPSCARCKRASERERSIDGEYSHARAIVLLLSIGRALFAVARARAGYVRVFACRRAYFHATSMATRVFLCELACSPSLLLSTPPNENADARRVMATFTNTRKQQKEDAR